MRIAEMLYFAPDLLFSEVDIDGPTLPEQFKLRMIGYYIMPAEKCCDKGFAFAAGTLLLTCIDALAGLQFGNGVGSRFQKFVRERLPSLADEQLARRFYCDFRNGLVHEARIKHGGQFSLERGEMIEEVDGFLLVNPKLLAAEVREALSCYVALLSRDPAQRRKLATQLRKHHTEEFSVAGLDAPH